METQRKPQPIEDIDIAELQRRAPAFKQRMQKLKREIPSVDFYPYDTMANVGALDTLLKGERRNLLRLAEGRPVADVAAADGDLAFFLETLGVEMQIIDNPPTNHNGLRGARALKQALSSSVAIHEVDLDTQFHLPRYDYGLIFFLGILYHLKSPYYVLEQLARATRHMVLSTRIAQYGRPLRHRGVGGRLLELAGNLVPRPRRMMRMAGLPVAYLVDERECNDDPTNFWIFTEEGLQRLLARTGWDVLDFRTFGERERSNPEAQDRDERAFCILRSRVFKG
jgi:tRNA (mo5U34)-methyltransferase